MFIRIYNPKTIIPPLKIFHEQNSKNKNARHLFGIIPKTDQTKYTTSSYQVAKLVYSSNARAFG